MLNKYNFDNKKKLDEWFHMQFHHRRVENIIANKSKVTKQNRAITEVDMVVPLCC